MNIFARTAGIVALFLVAASAAPLATQSPAAQSPTPQWQIAAGGKMAFDVASIKQNKSGVDRANPVRSNVPMDPGPSYSPNGGLLSATNELLSVLISFAYKIDPIQLSDAMRGLPAWVNSYRFDVQARAQGNPTKDQMRLMMQSLLADRFKLALHTETKEMAFYALVLASPGKTGPKLRNYADDPPCPDGTTPPRGFPANTLDMPATMPCGGFQMMLASGHPHFMGRSLSMPVLAPYIASLARLDHPAEDRTGLSGTFDLTLDYLPQPGQLGSNDPNLDASDPTVGPLMTALQDQLGLKLESRTGPVQVFVIDHVEEPSEN